MRRIVRWRLTRTHRSAPTPEPDLKPGTLPLPGHRERHRELRHRQRRRLLGALAMGLSVEPPPGLTIVVY